MTKTLVDGSAWSAAVARGGAGPAQSQAPARPQTPAPSADPYVNNPNPGATGFPLAAPAGTDSGAREKPPAGAVNQGPFDPADLEVRHRLRSARPARRSGTRSR